MKTPGWGASAPVGSKTYDLPQRLETFFTSLRPTTPLFLSVSLPPCVSVVAHKSHLKVTKRECLALIQNYNSSSCWRHREQHKISSPYFFGKGLHVHQKLCGCGGRIDCVATSVCQSCKQLKGLSHPLAANLVWNKTVASAINPFLNIKFCIRCNQGCNFSLLHLFDRSRLITWNRINKEMMMCC